jgi:hypothetical protein
MLEKGQVRAGVADVVVALVTESFAQTFQFVVCREVGFAIAGEYALEQAEVGCYALGQLLVCASGEIELASFAAFDFKIFDEDAVVRKVADVEGDAGADLSFDCGFATEEPEGKLQRVEGAAAHQEEQGVHEGVAFDQGAVQIDAERTPGHGGRQLLNGGLSQGNLSHGSWTQKPSELSRYEEIRGSSHSSDESVGFTASIAS